MMQAKYLVLSIVAILMGAQTQPVTMVSAASYATALAPEAIAAAFGANLATGTASAPASGPPFSLGGTQVSVQDSAGVSWAAPLFYVSSQQVNFEIPAGTAVGPATVLIASGGGAMSSASIQISNVAPALFSADGSGKGVAAGFAVDIQSGGSQVLTALSNCAFTPTGCSAIPVGGFSLRAHGSRIVRHRHPQLEFAQQYQLHHRRHTGDDRIRRSPTQARKALER